MNREKLNGHGANDPTAYAALNNISWEEQKFQKTLHTIFNIAALAGYQIEGRIVLIDKKTGRRWD